jgi:hypothetical protein
MLETVKPVQFHDATKSGRTKPSRLVCEKQDGSTVELIAKFSGGCDRKEASLAMEVVGACLAADLGLPVPTPYLLDVQADWIATVTDVERRKVMEVSSAVAFGSSQVGAGFRVWTTGDRVTDVMVPTAVGIFAFDAFINNPDRRGDNPNCLVRGTELRIFDHELAFLYKGVLFWREPWRVGALATMASPGNHIFHKGLQGQDVDLAPIRQAWLNLDDDRLAAYKCSMPAMWAAALSAVDDAINLIKGVRDNIDDALAEVRRVLT